jgi:nucleoside-diphosphate-sugar epimerase
MADMFPEIIENETVLEEVLTRPRPALVDFISSVRSPLVLLGAGGKMGPSLAVLARRAARAAGHPLEIVAVSRFSDPAARQSLEAQDIHTLSCDLMDADSLKALPEAENVIYLVGLKFGTAQNPAATLAVNTLAPANVCRRYPHSRMVALSSGSIYPLMTVAGGGAAEEEPLTPLGEYANACVARERIFEYFAQQNGTPVTLLRLFYAVELRYGVLVDIARKVQMGEPVELGMGYLNWIWQADANESILRSLALPANPPRAYNLTRPQIDAVRGLALRFGELLGKKVELAGSESGTALLGNPARLCARLGEPPMPLETALGWIAHWVRSRGRLLGKPTHFEVRDGRY